MKQKVTKEAKKEGKSVPAEHLDERGKRRMWEGGVEQEVRVYPPEGGKEAKADERRKFNHG
jgi:hypothetical protein